MRELSARDVEDILLGSVILGTGGGGSMEVGMRILREAENAGKVFRLASLTDLPADSLVAVPYSLGSLTIEDELSYDRLPRATVDPILLAADRMERYVGQRIEATVACETGGENTAVPLYVAAMRDGYLLDADIAGRAVPEVTNSTFSIHRLPASPVVVANEFGEVAILENLADDQRAEEVLRSLAMVSRNSVAAIDHAMPLREVQHALIPGTISKALELGRVFREAAHAGENIPQAVAEAGDGEVIFTGTVRSTAYDTVDGFTVGDVLLNGQDGYDGEELRIWFKNENLVCWRDGEVLVTLPDLICAFDERTGSVISNPEFTRDQLVTVVVFDAPEAFQTPRGLEVFGPKRFGFDVDYVPYSKKLKGFRKGRHLD